MMLTISIRRNSQKPSDDLYKTFKDSFPHLNPSIVATSGPDVESTLLTDALDISGHSQYVASKIPNLMQSPHDNDASFLASC